MLVIILLLICGALHTIVSFARWVTYLVTQKQHLKNRYRRTEVRLYKCGLCGLNGLCVYMYVGYTRIIYIIPYTVGALVRHFLLYTLSHSFPHSSLLSLLFPSSSFPHPPQVLRRRTKDVKTMQRQAANKTASTSSSLKEGGGMGTGIRRRRRLVRPLRLPISLLYYFKHVQTFQPRPTCKGCACNII